MEDISISMNGEAWCADLLRQKEFHTAIKQTRLCCVLVLPPSSIEWRVAYIPREEGHSNVFFIVLLNIPSHSTRTIHRLIRKCIFSTFHHPCQNCDSGIHLQTESKLLVSYQLRNAMRKTPNDFKQRSRC